MPVIRRSVSVSQHLEKSLEAEGPITSELELLVVTAAPNSKNSRLDCRGAHHIFCLCSYVERFEKRVATNARITHTATAFWASVSKQLTCISFLKARQVRRRVQFTILNKQLCGFHRMSASELKGSAIMKSRTIKVFALKFRHVLLLPHGGATRPLFGDVKGGPVSRAQSDLE